MVSKIQAYSYTAYYDLSTAPITFDMVYFLAGARAYGRSLGLHEFDIVLVADTWRNLTPREKAYDQSERNWRLWNLLLQLCSIAPSVRNVTVQRSPLLSVAALTYPPEYNASTRRTTPYSVASVRYFMDRGIDVLCFESSSRAQKSVTNLYQCKSGAGDLISLSPRVAGFDSSRDSRLAEWYRFYQYLVERGHQVVVVPDQDDLLSSRRFRNFDWNVAEGFALNLDLKLALYERCSCNFVASGGNIGPLILSVAPYVIVNSLIENSPIANHAYFQSIGIQPGVGGYPWARSNQVMSWTDDSFDSLVRVYEQMRLR